jgi:hypothetical protein
MTQNETDFSDGLHLFVSFAGQGYLKGIPYFRTSFQGD